MTNRALLITSLFTAGCIGALPITLHYAAALETQRPHYMRITLTSSLDPVTNKKACELLAQRWSADSSAMKDGWHEVIDCLPVKERE